MAIERYATYASSKLKQHVQNGSSSLDDDNHDDCRKEIPTWLEQEMLKRSPQNHRIAINTRIWFLDGTFVYIPVDSWTTVRTAIKKVVCDVLGATDARPYGLFEMRESSSSSNNVEQHVHHGTTTAERCLPYRDRLVDYLSYWMRMPSSSSEEFYFCVKVKHYIPLPLASHGVKDNAGTDLLYIQAVHDIIIGTTATIPSPKLHDIDTALLLALLQAYESHDTRVETNYRNVLRCVHGIDSHTKRPKLAQFLPATSWDDGTRAEMELRLARSYEALARQKGDWTSRRCREAYLRTVYDWKLYGSHFFEVRRVVVTNVTNNSNNNNNNNGRGGKGRKKDNYGVTYRDGGDEYLPETVTLAINRHGLFILPVLPPERRTVSSSSSSSPCCCLTKPLVLREFGYESIANWGLLGKGGGGHGSGGISSSKKQNTLMIVVSAGQHDCQTMIFRTSKGKEIIDVMEFYVSYYSGTSSGGGNVIT